MSTPPTHTPACATVDPGWWFSGIDVERQAAIALCGVCPLAQQCLELAMAGEGRDPAAYRYGIYAGTNGTQRWRIATGQQDWPTWARDPLAGPSPAVDTTPQGVAQ